LTEPLLAPLTAPLTAPLLAPLLALLTAPLTAPLVVALGGPGTTWPLVGGLPGSNALADAGTGGMFVAVIGSVVGQTGSWVAATGWMRTVGVSLLRWV
jgi:hypothetical protein